MCEYCGCQELAVTGPTTPVRTPLGLATRWVTDTGPDHSQWYVERFRSMAAAGADLDGEARLVDALLARGSHVLDGGCGPGRVSAGLHSRGHRVVGVDVDPMLLEAAEQDHPGPRWVVGDLAVLDLPAAGITEPFDAVVLAGNVLAFVAEGTEADVLSRAAAHLRPGGLVVIGHGADRGYPIDVMDADAATVALLLEQRFATWDLRPWHPHADFAVSVLRLAESSGAVT